MEEKVATVSHNTAHMVIPAAVADFGESERRGSGNVPVGPALFHPFFPAAVASGLRQ